MTAIAGTALTRGSADVTITASAHVGTAIPSYPYAAPPNFCVQPREFLDPAAPTGPAGGARHDRESREMFYFFRRGAASIKCEVRSDSAGQGYELVVARPDAMIRVERFMAPPDLNRRWREIERTLIREGWNGPRMRDM